MEIIPTKIPYINEAYFQGKELAKFGRSRGEHVYIMIEDKTYSIVMSEDEPHGTRFCTIWNDGSISFNLELLSFYFIYTVDIERELSLWDRVPDIIYHHVRRKNVIITEDDSCWDYDYMAEDDKSSSWWRGKHRKFVGEFDFDDFKTLVNDAYMYMESCDTMGSLTPMGHLPAMSFDSGSSYMIEMHNAYVTPFFSIDNFWCDEDVWDILKEQMLEEFSY